MGHPSLEEVDPAYLVVGAEGHAYREAVVGRAYPVEVEDRPYPVEVEDHPYLGVLEGACLGVVGDP